MIPLAKLQKQLMSEFYSFEKIKVVYNKKQRNAIWNKAKKRQDIPNFDKIERKCPALAHQIKRSYDSGNNIQSAVFCECVYAQTFATLFSLEVFTNCYENRDFIPQEILDLLNSYHLVPRYAYSNTDKSRMLIQAGGCGGIDSALITVFDLNIFTIEFKETSAKTSEPDLPKYGEDGVLSVTSEFLSNNPQFEEMLKEKTGLNFFEVMGSNIHGFSHESVDIAVSNNYTKKYADVICTEDRNGYLTMIPVNQVSQWATIKGEIRPSGRNKSKVWTPIALNRFLNEKKAIIKDGVVTIERTELEDRMPRGGNGKVTGYKINPLFFVYIEDCKKVGSKIEFNMNDIKQVKPTISGHMSFAKLNYDDVQNYYKNQLN